MVLGAGPFRVGEELCRGIRARLEEVIVKRSFVLQPPCDQRQYDSQYADRHTGAMC